MKYKRRLMTGMFALALMTGGSSVYASEDLVANSKIDQYQNQVQMKSPEKGIAENIHKRSIKKSVKSAKFYS